MENYITKNNRAWNFLFNHFNILEIINEKGYFKITADQIKESKREPRLMTKFDSSENLPKIFVDNNLAILPIKRGTYIIGRFKNYQDLEIDNNVEVKTATMPKNITTIQKNNITSEAVSLNAAYISGMLENILGEKVVPTLQGRMGTNKFDYNILLKNNATFNITVDKSQMEIDGSFEGETKYAILEAKNCYLNDFIIRQLYYPYRVLKNITNKKVVPIMLMKHDNIYNFYIYEFLDSKNYNSLKLIDIKRFILDDIFEPIEIKDIIEIMNKVKFGKETKTTPFPQANSFHRVLDLVNELNNKELTATEISELYEFDLRQGNYYLAAGIYLGLIEKSTLYRLTSLGKKIVKLNHKDKTTELIKLILSKKPFYVALEGYINNFEFNQDKIAESIFETRNEIKSMVTAKRRASTVISWIKWILEQTSVYDKVK